MDIAINVLCFFKNIDRLPIVSKIKLELIWYTGCVRSKPSDIQKLKYTLLTSKMIRITTVLYSDNNIEYRFLEPSKSTPNICFIYIGI